MVWGNPPSFISAKPKKAPKLITPEQLASSGSEDGHQAALFCWAASNIDKYPALKWLFAIPNGGSRHIAEAAKLVATGSRSGIPDIFLPKPMFGNYYIYHGLFIEMKKFDRKNHKNGGLSDKQLEFMKYAENAVYYYKVCYSWIEAKDILINYLEGKL
jgi:hypothetical protein